MLSPLTAIIQVKCVQKSSCEGATNSTRPGARNSWMLNEFGYRPNCCQADDLITVALRGMNVYLNLVIELYWKI